MLFRIVPLRLDQSNFRVFHYLAHPVIKLQLKKPKAEELVLVQGDLLCSLGLQKLNGKLNIQFKELKFHN